MIRIHAVRSAVQKKSAPRPSAVKKVSKAKPAKTKPKPRLVSPVPAPVVSLKPLLPAPSPSPVSALPPAILPQPPIAVTPAPAPTPVAPVPAPPATIPPVSADKTSLDVNSTFWKDALPPANNLQTVGLNAQYFAADINYTVSVHNSDPLVNIIQPLDWGNRTGGTQVLNQLRLPANFTIPDVTPGETPNNPVTVINQDTGEVFRLNGAVRPQAGGPIYAYSWNVTHGGSGLSGGEVTNTELENGIPHALAVNVQALKWLSYAGGGYTSPATAADSYASPITYGGTNPDLRMGSRLVIAPNVTAQQLGLTSQDGIQVLNALQQYGAYVVDDTMWDCFAINADTQAGARLNQASGDMLKLYAALQLVQPPSA